MFCLVKDGVIDLDSFNEDKTKMLFHVVEKQQSYKKIKEEISKVQELKDKLDFENSYILYPVIDDNEPTNKDELFNEYFLGNYKVKDNKVKRLWTTKERTFSDAKSKVVSYYKDKKSSFIMNKTFTFQEKNILLSEWLLQEDIASYFFEIEANVSSTFTFYNSNNEGFFLSKTQFLEAKTNIQNFLNTESKLMYNTINSLSMMSTMDALKSKWNNIKATQGV